MTDQTRSRNGELRRWLKENAPDCGDNSCQFGGSGKGGMRTNGGCRCFKDLPSAKRIYVERLYQWLQSETRRTDQIENNRAQNEHDEESSEGARLVSITVGGSTHTRTARQWLDLSRTALRPSVLRGQFNEASKIIRPSASTAKPVVEQEPVAWQAFTADGKKHLIWRSDGDIHWLAKRYARWEPLYAHPWLDESARSATGAAEKDAARYRWLRANWNEGADNWWDHGYNSEELDSSIDAAMGWKDDD